MQCWNQPNCEQCVIVIEIQADKSPQPMNANAPINSDVQLPGSTIGMVGGGQLGRMFAVAAASMGYRVVIFTDAEDSPASQVADQTVVGDLNDQASFLHDGGRLWGGMIIQVSIEPSTSLSTTCA